MEILEKEKINSLKDQVKEYVQTRIDIATLTAVKGGSKAAGNVALYLLLSILGFFFLLFASIALAFAISEWLDHRIAGFLIVAGIYLVAGILFFAFKSKLILEPLANAIINAVLNKENRNG